MNEEKFRHLLQGYLKQSLSEEELSAFLTAVNLPEYQSLLAESLDNDLQSGHFRGLTDTRQMNAAFEAVNDRIQTTSGPASANVVSWRSRIRFAAAAILILLLGTAGYQYLVKRPQAATRIEGAQQMAAHSTAAPGGNKAVLILGDGSRISLDSADNGSIADQGGTKVIKTDQGQLAYKTGGAEEVVFNTVATPKGGQYKVRLPDGSDVWLNSVSSIKFPTAFKGTDRTVEVNGEAYFEVKHDPKMPFKVRVNGMTIEVLGTHFNVNAYTNEVATRTTLLEGSVRVSKGKHSSLLSPGQQAQTGHDEDAINVLNDIDTEQAIAWKNGLFDFDKADIATIMRQIARWYDVEVDYSKVKSKELFWGSIERTLPLSSVLKILEKNKIHFQTDGNKITAFD